MTVVNLNDIDKFGRHTLSGNPGINAGMPMHGDLHILDYHRKNRLFADSEGPEQKRQKGSYFAPAVRADREWAPFAGGDDIEPCVVSEQATDAFEIATQLRPAASQRCQR